MIAALFARLFRSRAGAEVRAARRGDRDAIARFYDAHVEALYAFVFYRVGRDAALAEDVVQETFALALAKRAEFDPARGTPGAWLRVLSRNVIRDHVRDHHRVEQWERIDVSLAEMFAAMS